MNHHEIHENFRQSSELDRSGTFTVKQVEDMFFALLDKKEKARADRIREQKRKYILEESELNKELFG